MTNELNLFAEMTIDVDAPIDEIYKRAFNIGEDCGYSTFHNKSARCLEICGEDCPDEYLLINKVFYDPKTKKAIKIEKVLVQENDEGELKVLKSSVFWRAP